MTETINDFWQSFPTICSFGVSFTEKKEVNDLVGEARKITALADEEAGHAAKAENAIQRTEDENLRRDLTIIAVWHFERAAQQYGEAVALFVEATNLRVKSGVLEHFKRKANDASRRAQENEIAAARLKSQSRELFQN